MPRGKKFTAEQIIGKLREAEVGLAQGKTVPEVVRKLGVTEQTYDRWKREYGGLRQAVGQHAQQRKQIGPTLNLVDNNQALQRPQGCIGFIEPRQTRRIFKIEVVERIGGKKLAGQRGFAGLSRAKQGNDAAPLVRRLHEFAVDRTVDHPSGHAP